MANYEWARSILVAEMRREIERAVTLEKAKEKALEKALDWMYRGSVDQYAAKALEEYSLEARRNGHESAPRNVDGKDESNPSPGYQRLAEAIDRQNTKIRAVEVNTAISALHRQRGWGITAAVLGAAMMAGGCSSTFGLSEWPSGSILKTQSVAQSEVHDLFGRLSRQGGGGAE
jgi:hypothetical protein